MESGEFEKLKVYAYTDPGCADDKLAALDVNPVVANMNPENYSREIKVEFNNGQGSGTSGGTPRFEKKMPNEMAFELLYDETGIIYPTNGRTVAQDLEYLESFLMGYEGDIHQTRFFKGWKKDFIARFKMPEVDQFIYLCYLQIVF